MARQPPGRTIVRPGEGALIEITRQADKGEVSLDLAEAPVPDRSMLADAVAVQQDRYAVKILFGQLALVGGGLRGLLCIFMTVDAVNQFLGTAHGFGERMTGYLSRNDLSLPAELQLGDTEPQHVSMLRANLIAAANSEMESTIDFYHLSARSKADLARFQSQRKVGIEPVVRVHTSTPVVGTLLHRFREIAAGEEK